MNGWHGKLENSFDCASYHTLLIVKTLSNPNYWFIFLRKEKEISFYFNRCKQVKHENKCQNFIHLYGYKLLIPFKSP